MSRRTAGYGNLIRNARESRGWTQQELAERLSASASTISNLEREQHAPTVPDQVNALVRELPLSAEDLLRAMGVNVLGSAAARLPREWITLGLEMTEAGRHAFLQLMREFVGREQGRR